MAADSVSKVISESNSPDEGSSPNSNRGSVEETPDFTLIPPIESTFESMQFNINSLDLRSAELESRVEIDLASAIERISKSLPKMGEASSTESDILPPPKSRWTPTRSVSDLSSMPKANYLEVHPKKANRGSTISRSSSGEVVRVRTPSPKKSPHRKTTCRLFQRSPSRASEPNWREHTPYRQTSSSDSTPSSSPPSLDKDSSGENLSALARVLSRGELSPRGDIPPRNVSPRGNVSPRISPRIASLSPREMSSSPTTDWAKIAPIAPFIPGSSVEDLSVEPPEIIPPVEITPETPSFPPRFEPSDSIPKIRPNSMAHVSEVNWAGTHISRAGIIPIYTDGIHKWIGLGISRFSGNLITIGGRYESTDHDLLATAVREYNEEMGSNWDTITEEELMDCYTVQSSYSISIFLPFSKLPTSDFIPTDEIWDVIWVTPPQLNTMASRQDFVLTRTFKVHRSKEHRNPIGRKSTSKAFHFSNDLRLLAQTIAWTVEMGTPFVLPRYPKLTSRPARRNVPIPPRVCDNFKIFAAECQTKLGWGHAAAVTTENRLILMRADGNIYILPLEQMDAIISYLNWTHIKIYVSTRADIDRFHRGFQEMRSKMVTSIEYAIARLNNPEVVQTAFVEKLAGIRKLELQQEAIIHELYLILQYESIIYRLMEQQGGFFNDKRAYFLKISSIINRLLIQNPHGLIYHELKDILDAVYPQYNNGMVINMMLTTKLIYQRQLDHRIYL